MKNSVNKIATIPFAGFYETLHDMAIDDAFNALFQDSNGDANQGLRDKAWIFADFSEAFEDYAKNYAEAFCEEFKVNAKFESMKGTKDYFSGNDVVYIELAIEEAKRLFDAVDKEVLDTVCRDNLTSRSGFSSFYNPDYTEWGDVSEWDHNQLGQLMEAIAKQENPDFDMQSEYDLMDGYLCNGSIEGMIYNADKRVQRFVKIANYLRQREERAYR